MRCTKFLKALPLAALLVSAQSLPLAAAGLAPTAAPGKYERICATRLATRLGVPLFTIRYAPRDVTEVGNTVVHVHSNDGLGRAACEISSRGVVVQVVIQV